MRSRLGAIASAARSASARSALALEPAKNPSFNDGNTMIEGRSVLICVDLVECTPN
jgi:hypothetical protein